MTRYIDYPTVAYKRIGVAAWITDENGNEYDMTDEVFSRSIDKYPYDREHPIAKRRD